MDFEEVKRAAHWPLWFDGAFNERAMLPPFPLATLYSNRENWKAMGERLRKIDPAIPIEELLRIGPFWATTSPDSHIGPFLHAIDFLVDDGTPVVSMWNGIVHAFEDGNDAWGPDEAFAEYLNYITILDPDTGLFYQYCHLEKGSVQAAGRKIGSPVQANDRIGIVGKTGWTDRDHLHVIVFEGHANLFGFKSLKIRWASDFPVQAAES